MRRAAKWIVTAAVLAAAGYAAWRWRADVPWPGALRPASPHDAYARGLERAGLAGTALARQWLDAATRALDAPLEARPSFVEVAAFPPDQPHALGYRLALQRGQRVRAVAEPEQAADARVFLDLFEVRDDERRPVASAASESSALEVEIRRSGTYVLRVQPELLHGGRVRITQRVEGALRFPVHDEGRPSVRSHFGAPRDGGRREHHGIDIFAPRGTSVLAAADGVVSRVTTNALGGNVVWVWDLARMQSHYYAHLDEQTATPGQRVAAGDPIGTVGNTGNARSTPPHLHFGIYAAGEGPIDPFPFVARDTPPAPPVRAPLDPLGSWARTVQPRVPLRSAATAAGAIVERLPRDARVRVIGAADAFHRVRTTDGTEGYVDARATAPAPPPWGGFGREGDAPATDVTAARGVP